MYLILPAILISKGIKTVSWYDFVNDGTSVSQKEENFGIMDSLLNLKPSYDAYMNMTTILKETKFIKEITNSSSVKVLVFENGLDAAVPLFYLTYKDVKTT